MSGFLAVQTSGPLDRAGLERMCAAAAHRGTARAWISDDVAMVAFEGRAGSGLLVHDDLVLVLDARLDAGDVSTLAEAWRRSGARALERIDGDFAGAVWDRRARCMTVFRDPCAGRHAVVAQGRDRMTAASTLPILLADPAFDVAIDDEWIVAYLSGEPGFATATGVRAVDRVQPGHVATVHDGRWDQKRWYSWRAERVRERDDASYADALSTLLRDSARRRTAGTEKIGISLSGGLDSTSIAAAVRLERPDAEIVALAVPFDAPQSDERASQQLVADRIGARMHWAPLGDLSPFGRSPFGTLDVLGAPPVAPNQFFVDRVVEAGSDAGIDVALDGIDGDAAVGGNWSFLSDLLVRGRWSRFRTEARGLERTHHVSRAQIARFALEPLVPPFFRSRMARPDFVDAPAYRDRDPWRPGRAFRANESLGVSPDVAPAVLESIDGTWAARGIQAVHPFMDRALMEFCLGLPREQKIRGGLTKIVLRNAFRGVLPPEVTERAEKAELSASFNSALIGPGSLWVHEGLAALMSNPRPRILPEGVARMLERFGKGSGGVDAFRLAYVGLWGEHIDSAGLLGEHGRGQREGAAGHGAAEAHRSSGQTEV